MPAIPRLVTERLVLRPFILADGPRVEELAGERQVADTTLTIPHPYPRGAGAEWIATHGDAWQRGERLVLAIGDREREAVLGAISLHVTQSHRHGELAYWIGGRWWGHGYATEAARALITYAFTTLELHRIQGRHFIRNAASGRVLQKLGMLLEGVHRDAFLRWDHFEDVAVYGILRAEWTAVGRAAQGESPNGR